MKKLLLVLVMLSMLVAVPRVAKAFTMIEIIIILEALVIASCPELVELNQDNPVLYKEATLDWVSSRDHGALDIGLTLNKNDPAGSKLQKKVEVSACMTGALGTALSSAASQNGNKEFNFEVSDYAVHDSLGAVISSGRVVTGFSIGQNTDEMPNYAAH